MASCHMLTAWLAPMALLLLVSASKDSFLGAWQQLGH